jgi:hypothetical protein
MGMKVGVKISPQVLEMLVRSGARITGDQGFAAQLTENGIPENYQLINRGFDRETGQFFLIFGEDGKRGPGPVEWQAPVYEREKEAGDETNP